MKKPSVELILASASSRRCELLEQLGILYHTQASKIDETPAIKEMPSRYVQRMARTKAKAVWQSSAQNLPVLAADTIITFDGVIIGKPRDRQHAKQILSKLSGRKHQVLTALCLCSQQEVYESIVESIVKFRDISSAEIEAYCSTTEPDDKAGAYAIQGLAANFVEYLSGSYTGVMGLPLFELRSLLQQAGLHP